LTGGGAIWHHHEVTYALVVAANHPLARPSTHLYRAVHAAIIRILAECGVSAMQRGNTAGTNDGNRHRPLLCFMDKDPEDIVTNGAKIVGSAQRRRGGAVLQHGSLLLARSSHTPELIGVCDVADGSARVDLWSERLLARIPSALGLRHVEAQVPAQARDKAMELEQNRYQNAAWTGLR
jgi:lipoate-protein ligase A